MNKIINNLYIGNVFDAIDIINNPLDSKDFSGILSAGSEFVLDPVYNKIFLSEKEINHNILSFYDGTKISDKFIKQAINFIDENIKNGKVLVHCHAGKSRSPALVFAYLISKGYPPLNALKLIYLTRKIADIYQGFVVDVLTYFNLPSVEIDGIVNELVFIQNPV